MFDVRLTPIVSALTLVLLTACATTQHDTVALTGAVEAVRSAAAKAGIQPVQFQAPGAGGATAGAMQGLVSALTATGPYQIYKIRMLDNAVIEVPSFDQLKVGDCIDVLVAPHRTNIYSFWTPGEITVRPSNACPPRVAG
jgi:hypothetical protein